TPDMQYRQLLSLTEDMLGGRNANRSVAVIRALIQFIVQSWQGQFAKNVVMKFNCFFLLPFIDVFPAHLREEVDRVYSSKEADVLLRRQREAQAVRDELQRSRDALVAESAANVNLQQKFSSLLAILSQQRDISANGTNRVASTRGDYLVSPTHRIYTPLRNPSEKKKRISFHPPSISRKHDVY
ncbi:ARC5, partial [Symbiodinium microadriaticum]